MSVTNCGHRGYLPNSDFTTSSRRANAPASTVAGDSTGKLKSTDNNDDNDCIRDHAFSQDRITSDDQATQMASECQVCVQAWGATTAPVSDDWAEPNSVG